MSIRYGKNAEGRERAQNVPRKETDDIRRKFIKLSAWLQNKTAVIVDSDSAVCTEVLNASEIKGNFIETLLATPAWKPIYSIESVDGVLWKELSVDFKNFLGTLHWRDRMLPLVMKYSGYLLAELNKNSSKVVNAEKISRLVLQVFFELVFNFPISTEDESLFYQASLEWRKEIGMKGRGDLRLKDNFWKRLSELVRSTDGLNQYLGKRKDPGQFLSVLAQPFLISPQINISDIMVAVYGFLREEPSRFESARRWVEAKDRARVGGIILESIRLQHPFPILERELPCDKIIGGKKYKSQTQFFLLFDQFKQDTRFDPERWLLSSSENPYFSMPFGSGPRMCPGKPLAMELMVELLAEFISRFPDHRIQPALGHLYSGRDNDKSPSFLETLYQAGVCTRALWKSYQLGRSEKRLALKSRHHSLGGLQ